MPLCPKCGKDIREPVNYCPNCSFSVANLFKEVEGSQQPAATPAPAPAVVKGIRTSPITAASIICLLIGVGNLILGFALFGLTAGIGGQIISSSTPPITKVLITLGLSFGIATSISLMILAALDLLGWYWLWEAKVKGGVVGIFVGLIDIGAVITGIVFLMFMIPPTMGLPILALPFLLPVLVVVPFLGLVLLIMIAIGWKTLK